MVESDDQHLNGSQLFGWLCFCALCILSVCVWLVYWLPSVFSYTLGLLLLLFWLFDFVKWDFADELNKFQSARKQKNKIMRNGLFEWMLNEWLGSDYHWVSFDGCFFHLLTENRLANGVQWMRFRSIQVLAANLQRIRVQWIASDFRVSSKQTIISITICHRRKHSQAKDAENSE